MGTFVASGEGHPIVALLRTEQSTLRTGSPNGAYSIYIASEFEELSSKAVRLISNDEPFDISLPERNVSTFRCGCYRSTLKSVVRAGWSERVSHALNDTSFDRTGVLPYVKRRPMQESATNGRYARPNNASDFNFRADAENTALLSLSAEPRPFHGRNALFDVQGAQNLHFDIQVVGAGEVRGKGWQIFERACNRRPEVIDPNCLPANRKHIHLDYVQSGSPKLA